MIVRVADENDFHFLVPAVSKMINEIVCPEYASEDPDVMTAAVKHFLSLEIIETVVAEEEEIIGFFTVLYSPYQWNPARICAEEQGVWVHPDASPRTFLRLLRLVQQRMRERGVSIAFGKAREEGPDSIQRIYNTLGMKPFQTYYIGEVG